MCDERQIKNIILDYLNKFYILQQKKHEQIIEEEEPLECVLNQTFKKPKFV